MSPHINLHKAAEIYTASKTSSEGEKGEKCIFIEHVQYVKTSLRLLYVCHLI